MIRPAVLLLALSTLSFSCVSAHAIGLGNFFGALVGGAGDTGHGASDVDNSLQQLTRQINRRAPMKVDADTRFDHVNAEPGHKLVYHYTLLGARSDQVSQATLRDSLTPALRQRVCAANDLRAFLRNGISLSYSYQGSDGKPIGDISFGPDACKQSDQAGTSAVPASGGKGHA